MSEVFSMVQVFLNIWDVFVKVNNFYESGKFKGQKFLVVDVVSGIIFFKQWYMKFFVSFFDDFKFYLLNKVRKIFFIGRYLVGI